MSPTAVRLLATLALVLFLTGLWFIVLYGVLEHTPLSEAWGLGCTNVTCSTLLLVAWWLIWRPVLPPGAGGSRAMWLSGMFLTAAVVAASLLHAWPPLGDWPPMETVVWCTLPTAAGTWLIYAAWHWRARGGAENRTRVLPAQVGLRVNHGEAQGWAHDGSG